MTTVTRYFTTRNLALLAILAMLDSGLSYAVLGLGLELFRENAWMENLQWLMLAISGLGFLTAAICLGGRQRTVAGFFALLCFIFIFREVDFDKLDIPQWIIFLLADNRGRAIFFVAALVLLGLMLKDFRHYLDHRKTYLQSDLFACIALAATFLVVFSTAFEQHLIHTGGHRAFFEELSEVTAYYFLMVAGILALTELRTIAEQTLNPPAVS